MSTFEITIDPSLWETGTEARRHEWRGAMEGLLRGQDVVFRTDLRSLLVLRTEQGFIFRSESGGDEPISDITLPYDKLNDHIHEYVDVVRQLAKAAPAGSLARLEALDMAKKVCHDRAARVVERACRILGVDHATARRIFTLLVTLKVDTTRLVGVHGHRRIR